MASLLLLLSLMGTTSSVFADDYIYKVKCNGHTMSLVNEGIKYCDVPGINLDEWKYYEVDLIEHYSTVSEDKCQKGSGYDLVIKNDKLQVRVRWMCNGYFGIKRSGFPYKGGCGQDNFGGFKILNGRKAQACHFPWMAAIHINWKEKGSCGASIINQQWILTAAHCLVVGEWVAVKVPSHSVFVYTGSLRGQDGPILRKVKEIVLHPKYDFLRLRYDIALLKLEEDIKWDGCHAPVCLNKNKTVEESRSLTCRVSGWGKETMQYHRRSSSLLWAYHRILSRKKCDNIYKKYSDDYTLCGRPTANSGRGFCDGDSGGPLVCKSEEDGRFYQHGIVSGSYSYFFFCKKEGIYTNVAALHDWISKYIPNV